MKTSKILALISLLISTIIITNPSVLSEESSKTIYVDDDGDKDYATITEAVLNASDGDTIYVYSGIYYGSFNINKSISLTGADKEKTIITGENEEKIVISDTTQDSSALINIIADNVEISGFTIRNSTRIVLLPSEHLEAEDVEASLAVFNVGIGIMISSDNNTISGNIIKDNGADGIVFNFGQNTIISDNEIINNPQRGIFLQNCSNNLIINNEIANSLWGVIFLNNSYENVFYHNNFINNSLYHTSDNGKNIFYSTELKQGNYWDDYDGTDKNNDAICDMPYNITGGNNKDSYPLMSPYMGRLVIEEYYVDEGSVIFMLIVGMVITIIFSIPVAYIWYRKTRPPE